MKLFIVCLVVQCLLSCEKHDKKNDSNNHEQREQGEEKEKFIENKKLVRIFSTNSPGQKQDVRIYSEVFVPEFEVEAIEVKGDKDDGKTLLSNEQTALVNIFIEHVYDLNANKKAKFNWLMINQEFVDSPDRLENIDLVLCKTQLAADLMLKYAEKYHLKFRVYYSKFTSFIDASVILGKDFDLALHSAGKSPFKNTGSVLHAWMKNPGFPKLIVTCRDYMPGDHNGCLSQNAKPVLYDYQIPIVDGEAHMASNLELFTGFVSQSKLENWQNQAGYYIVPSSVEGYGHYINEGRAKGAVVITTDAPPMNEMVEDGVTGFLVPVKDSWLMNTYSGALAYGIDPSELAKVIDKVVALPEDQKLKIGENGRKSFLADRVYFQNHMRTLVSSLAEHGDLSGVPENTYATVDRETAKRVLKKACLGVMSQHQNTGVSGTGISKTYVINLDRSKDRLAAMCHEFSQADMKFTRFRAIDGKEKGFYADTLENKKIYQPLELVSKKQMTPGEFGIYYSHYDIWKNMIEEDHHVGMVFEDDARFNKDLRANLKTIMSNAPTDWDMIFLGCRVGDPHGADSHKLIHEGSFDLLVDGKSKPSTFLRVDGQTTTGLYGYLLTQSMAQHIVNHAMPIQGPIDLMLQIFFIGNPQSTSMFGPRKAYCVFPEPVWYDKKEPSTITEYGRKG
ncbi:MAG: glycosyltransferase family 25 protein [Myxococcaceae bacterium]